MSKQMKVKDIPMLTSDGVEIKVGTKLYVSHQEGRRSEPNFEIKEFAVCLVNPSTRRVTMKDSDGREINWTMMERNMAHYRGKKSSAVKDMIKEIAEAIEEQTRRYLAEKKNLDLLSKQLEKAKRI